MAAGSTLRRLARDVSQFATEWPGESTRLIASEVDAQLRADLGGDKRMSNHKGRALGTKVEDNATESTVEATGSKAQWAILNDGTQPHKVVAKRGKVLATPKGPRPAVKVRGVRAKRTWDKALRRSMKQVQNAAETGWQQMGGR